MSDEQLKYQIGITLVDGVGDHIAKEVIAFCGGVEAIFKEKLSALQKIPRVGKLLAKAVKSGEVLERAEKEIGFINKHDIKAFFYLDKDYPNRLKHCDDSPVMLYFMGEADLNKEKIISIVGTRSATSYGKKICEKIVEGLTEHHVTIVSGLAYGIDVCAHKAALRNGLPTLAVLAHGLDRLYPAEHRNTAKKMMKSGGILTDYISKSKFHPGNFPQRNRIVAGLADAVIVIESAMKGGSLITANIANSYNRDVFAVPGRVGDKHSVGCNWLIRTHKAAVIESAKDLEYVMGWQSHEKSKHIQKELFVELSDEERALVNLIKNKGQISIDNLSLEAKMNMSRVASLLLNLEFSGVIRPLPGKMYELN